MSGDLADRVRRLEDRQELSDLVALYGRLVDDRDLESLRTLYTTDAVFDAVEGPIEGRDAVVSYYAERLRLFGPSLHIPHSQTVEFLDADTARGVVTAHAELGMEDGSFWVALRYHDDYRREAGRWRFHRRVVRQLYAMPLRELVDDLAAAQRVRWPATPARTADIPESLPTWSAWTRDRSDT